MTLKASLAFAVAAMLLSPVFGANAQEVLTNKEVLKLAKAGLPADVIVAKIKSIGGNFQVSTDDLIELKSSGVPGPVLIAMLESRAASNSELSADSPDPNVPHYPGIYMFGAEDQRMVRIQATASDQSRTGGTVGYLLTAGLAATSIKASIPGKNARVQSFNTQPVFYMFFDESVPRVLAVGSASVWQSNGGSITTSPSELSLVQFSEKKGTREARIGSSSIVGSKQGVMDKDRMALTIEEIRPGVFKVTPTEPLRPGEYGFIQPLSAGRGKGSDGSAARVYAFGIAE
jgi:hypothetical protein